MNVVTKQSLSISETSREAFALGQVPEADFYLTERMVQSPLRFRSSNVVG
jgi:hypothetical protein